MVHPDPAVGGGGGIEGGEHNSRRLLLRPFPLPAVQALGGAASERRQQRVVVECWYWHWHWRRRRRERRRERADGLGGKLHAAALLLGGLLHEAARDAVGVLGEPGEERHELVGPPLRGLQAPAHLRQLLPDGRLLLPQPLHLLEQRRLLLVIRIRFLLLLMMMMMILARTGAAAGRRRVVRLRLRVAAGGGAGSTASLAALLAAHDARQQVRLAAQERLVRELPPVRVHLPEPLHAAGGMQRGSIHGARVSVQQQDM